MIESVLLFFSVILLLMAGFPVAFTLGGVALIFAGIGLITGNFDSGYLNALPSRLYGTMTNETLMAVPLFIFMGITLEKAKIAEDLEALTQEAMKLGEAIYKAQQSSQEEAPSESNEPEDGTIVDADFEEVDEENKS